MRCAFPLPHNFICILGSFQTLQTYNSLIKPGRTNTQHILTDPPDPQRNTFRFFDLPRELRDEIHDLCLQDQHAMELKSTLRLEATNTVRANPLLVSHQYAHEYLARAQKHATLKLSDTMEFGANPRDFALPTAVGKITHVTLRLTRLFSLCR